MLNLQNIPLVAITPSPYQVRKAFNPLKLQELADSLARDGQAHPILVRLVGALYEIVCGERRWRAMLLVPGATAILAQVRELTDAQARRLTAAENVQREDLSPIEWIEAIAQMVDAELIEDAAYAALAEKPVLRVRTQLMKLQSDETHGTTHVSKFTNEHIARLFASLPRPVTWQSYLTNDLPLLNLPEPVKELAITEKLSKSKAEALGDLHHKAPQKFAQVVEQGGVLAYDDLLDWTARRDEIRPLAEVSAREIRGITAHATIQLVKSTPAPVETPALPDDTYRCLVIDPPWPMDKSERTARPTQGDHLDYPVMSLEAIQALPIADLAHSDGCHVYLWVTHRFLPEGLRCFEAWGVHYHCLLTWVKPTGMTPFSWMFNTEHVLFGWIGHLPLVTMGRKVSFEAPVTEHSTKPEVFYDVVRAVSPAPRLDLFARADHDAFSRWGHEARA